MMKGLITKEILVLIKNNKMQLFCILLMAVFGVVMNSAAYIMFIPLLFPMLVNQVLTVDETSRWDKYSVCFPVDKKDIVSSKYIVALMASLLSVILSLAALIAINIVNKDKTIGMNDIVGYLTAAASASIILPSIMYPFDFKFGTAKGRLVYFTVTGVAIAGLTAFFIKKDLTSYISRVTQPVFIAVILAAALIIFIVSWFVSAKIYEAREI
ncbi:ABC-2 transporter permease [Ruminococcus sp.]|uniref:ABC-2 transporter permease n=1 Tax=Ruminococcus sp. TaxID=41978 RepID=UPI0025DF2580|nr:ABC-2 transporter permease [Ruminococcus sp.]